MAKVEIKSGLSKSSVEIHIDGQRIAGLTKFSVESSCTGDGWPPRVRLEVLATELMIDVEDADYRVDSVDTMGRKIPGLGALTGVEGGGAVDPIRLARERAAASAEGCNG